MSNQSQQTCWNCLHTLCVLMSSECWTVIRAVSVYVNDKRVLDSDTCCECVCQCQASAGQWNVLWVCVLMTSECWTVKRAVSVCVNDKRVLDSETCCKWRCISFSVWCVVHLWTVELVVHVCLLRSEHWADTRLWHHYCWYWPVILNVNVVCYVLLTTAHCVLFNISCILEIL